MSTLRWGSEGEVIDFWVWVCFLMVLFCMGRGFEPSWHLLGAVLIVSYIGQEAWNVAPCWYTILVHV